MDPIMAPNMWRKENGVYVDLLQYIDENPQYEVRLEEAPYTKSKKDSEYARFIKIAGDKELAIGKLDAAIKTYTMSLRYAEIDKKEDIINAYERRSFCFFQLRMYAASLRDIELAINAGATGSILERLEARITKCHSLNNTPEAREYRPVEPTRDYDDNEDYPCLAQAVDVNYIYRWGRHLIANREIPKDKVIILEQHFALDDANDFEKCYTCLRAYQNFIACENCCAVIFCNRECMDAHPTHAMECGTFFVRMRDQGTPGENKDYLKVKFIIQTLFNALVAYPTVESLMIKVEEMLREDRTFLPTGLLDAQSKYHFFFKLSKLINDETRRIVRLTYMFAMELPKIRELFNTPEKRRFLIHLIAHHHYISDTNKFGNINSMIANNVFSLFNHSCDPDIKDCDFRNMKGGRTTRRIRAGEQIYISYIPLGLPKSVRQRELLQNWGFECTCYMCIAE